MIPRLRRGDGILDFDDGRGQSFAFERLPRQAADANLAGESL